MALKIKIDQKEAARALKDLKKDLEAVGSSAVKNEKEMAQLEKRFSKGFQAKKASEATDRLKKSLNLTKIETVKLKASMGDYSGALKALTAAATPSAASLKNLAMSLASVAAVAGTVGIAALTATVYKSLSAFAELDEGLIGVEKTTGLTAQEMDVLEKKLLDTAANVPVTTKSILDIAQAAGQLGVKGVDNIQLFTETMAKLEVASDIAGEEGAKSLARLLNTAGEGTGKIDELASAIVALGNNMAASESEIVEMANEIGRSVSAFNVSSDASTAYGAALKAMGAKAEVSGSAIGRSMIEIEKAILAGGDKFEYLQRVTGMTGDAIKKAFKEDATIVFNAWIKGMGEMSDSGVSSVQMLEQFGLKGTETVKGLTPLIQNVGMLDQAFGLVGEEMKNATALEIEAAKATESYRAQMTLTKNVLDGIAAKIGESLAPLVLELAEDFRDWVEENDELIEQDLPKFIKAVADQVGGAIKYMVNLTKALVNIYKKSENVRKILEALGKVIKLLTTPVRNFYKLLGYAADKAIEFSDSLDGANESAVEFKDKAEKSRESLDEFKDTAGETKEELSETNEEVGRTVEKIDELGDKITKKLIPPFDKAKEKTNDLAESEKKLQDELSKSKDEVKEFDDAMFDSTETTNSDIEAKKDWIEKTGEAREEHKNFTDGIKDDVAETATDDLWDPMSQGFKRNVDDMGEYFKDGLDGMSQSWSEAFDQSRSDDSEHDAIWDNMGTFTNTDGTTTDSVDLPSGTTILTTPYGSHAITLGIDTRAEFEQLAADLADYRATKYGIDTGTPAPNGGNNYGPDWLYSTPTAKDFSDQISVDPDGGGSGTILEPPKAESQAKETPSSQESTVNLSLNVNVGGATFDAAVNESIKLNPEVQNNIRRTVDV